MIARRISPFIGFCVCSSGSSRSDLFIRQEMPSPFFQTAMPIQRVELYSNTPSLPFLFTRLFSSCACSLHRRRPFCQTTPSRFFKSVIPVKNSEVRRVPLCRGGRRQDHDKAGQGRVRGNVDNAVRQTVRPGKTREERLNRPRRRRDNARLAPKKNLKC